jgi:hypothetical protein
MISCFCNANAQIDTVFYKEYKRNIIEVEKLKNELQLEKDNASKSILEHTKQIQEFQIINNTLQNQNKDLLIELSEEKKKLQELNKSKIKNERDQLIIKIDSLNDIISKLNLVCKDYEGKLIEERLISKLEIEKAKEKGKNESLKNISKAYIEKSFDELIISTNKEIIKRDLVLLSNNNQTNTILNDLNDYYTALDVISRKYDTEKIKSALLLLTKINSKSQTLKVLADNLDKYADYNNYLKETLLKIINIDSVKDAGINPDRQKSKFNEIMENISDFIYNYDDYTQYPYLAEIVNEIISRKKDNADKPITDLLLKL